MAVWYRDRRSAYGQRKFCLAAPCGKGTRDCSIRPLPVWDAQIPPVTISQALQVGIEHHRAGRLAEAQAAYEQILAAEPNHADGLNLLGLVAHESGRPEAAVESMRRAIASKPTSAMYHHNLGLALSATEQFDEALAAYREALRLDPGYAMAQDNLGAALLSRGRFTEAVAAHRAALRINPNSGWAHHHLGIALTFHREFDEALRCFQRGLQLEPGAVKMHSSFLTFLQYQPSVTPAGLLAAHGEFDRLHTAPLRAWWQPHANSREPERRLRLGFISPHFANHPVGRFIVRLFENLNAREFEIVCYSDTIQTDATTDRLRTAAYLWHDVPALSDEQLAARIREDRVDILFDLAGQTRAHRLLVFARKPAPIQITWCDYVGTTGLSAIDYILGDPREIPAGAEQWYREKVLRLPDDYICYDPPADAPQVGPVPALAAGHITFGSFNLLAKMSPQAIAAWAQILHAVPRSRLLVKNLGFDEAATRERFVQSFATQGISAERIEMLGWSTSAETLPCYHRVDLALDPFPYNGGLTTCEAIWMGVPVVTCPGETFAGRHGLAHLTAAGLTETIASDPEQYVKIATNLANDLPRLVEWRATQRERIAASPLCDGERFAAHFSKLMREVWRLWLEA